MSQDIQKTRSRKTYLFSGIFITACLVVLLIYLFVSGDVNMLPSAFAWPRSMWLVLGVVLMASSLLVESKVLASMAETLLHPINMRMAFRATMVVQFFNNVTPSSSGGQPMQIWSLWRDGMTISDATVIQLGKYVVYQSTLALCCILALVVDYRDLASTVGGWRWLFVISFIIQMIILAFVLLLILKPRSMRLIVGFFERLISHTPLRTRLVGLFGRLNAELDRYEDSAGILMTDARTIGRFFLITLVQLLLFYSVPYCVCRSLGVHIPLWKAIAAAAFVLMVSGIVPLPGASGGAEGTFFLVFGQFFTGEASVAVAILLWRLLTFYLPIIVGAPFCTNIGRTPTRVALDDQFEKERAAAAAMAVAAAEHETEEKAATSPTGPRGSDAGVEQATATTPQTDTSKGEPPEGHETTPTGSSDTNDGAS
jgi:uncharacterized protein (TIRG00374 family)